MPIAADPEQQPPGGEPDPFADLVLDEDFVKGATVKEQSGRSRMLAAKWRREPPQEEPQAWRPPTEIRRRRFGRQPKAVDPWGNPKRRSRPNWQAPVFVLLTVAVVAAALNVNGLHSWYLGNFGSKPDNGIGALPVSPRPVITQAPETARPTAAPSTDAPLIPTVAQPWLGSPAETWPAGADAIVLPQAQDTGVFSADEVAAQLKLVKQFLVGANLDQGVLAGGDTQQVVDLLGGKSRARLQDALVHPDRDNDPASWISRFNPRTAIPVGSVVKLQGRITFEGDTDQHDKKGVVVHTDYTFVYALVPGPQVFDPSSVPGPAASPSGNPQSVSLRTLEPTAKVTREIVRRVQDFVFYDPADFNISTDKLYFGKSNSSMGNNHCEMGDGWLEPAFPRHRLPGGQSSPGTGPTTDPYDRSKPLPDDGKCGTVSRQ